ncbi:protein C12orf4 homolog [Nilaparvata lugens]|uniref:protein C12orf4 homolog n=1 Tax=Nilaparvata lugens TaxID=108931 RepID=UPI00193D7A0F|nr:protein C12orf4 homolog [Nilaparvata lugens]
MRTETERFDCTSKTFEFKFPMLTRQDEYVLQIPVDIPYQGSALELAQRILSSFQLPAYVEKDLENALSKFIECETINYYDDEAEKAIEEASKPSYDIEDVIKLVRSLTRRTQLSSAIDAARKTEKCSPLSFTSWCTLPPWRPFCKWSTRMRTTWPL